MSAILEPASEPVHRRAITVPLLDVEWRDSGNPDTPNETTLRGHAAVFNSLSDDLGGFRELIEPGAFRAALRRQPDVRLLLNHDPSYVMARTASGSLELREDSTGLHMFARVDRNITWVSDLRRSMLRGDIDQASFAFTIGEGGDDWAVTDDGTVVRTIRSDGVDQLFDVSVVAYPAYRATSVNMRGVLEDAITNGRLPQGVAIPIVAETGGQLDSHIVGSDVRRRKLQASARARAAVIRHTNPQR